jgi:glycosyltransferase involved in cell wall biosynthesis
MDAALPLVSVIMSVHNGERWLREAIDSIIRQTLINWEFIIIDDASGEEARRILESYFIDPRVKVIHKDRQQGLTKNLNLAIDHSTGEFIARMDADDISNPDRLAKQVAFLQKNPSVDAVGSFVSLIDEEGKAMRTLWADDRKASSYPVIAAMLPSRNCLAHPSVMIRAIVLKQYRYNESHTQSQDWDLWLRMINDGKSIEKIQESLLQYRVHDSSVTSTSNKKSAYRKKHEFYQRYLADSKPGTITSQVRKNYRLNRVKLFLSGIKRRFTS